MEEEESILHEAVSAFLSGRRGSLTDGWAGCSLGLVPDSRSVTKTIDHERE